MINVLVLDDEQVVRLSFVNYFDDLMWHTVQAESAEAALELINTERLDAAVVDIRLPGLDGNEFIKKVHGINPSIVFVVCTGSPEYLIPNELLCIEQVSKTVFRKPVTDFNFLRTEIQKLIMENSNGSNENNENDC